MASIGLRRSLLNRKIAEVGTRWGSTSIRDKRYATVTDSDLKYFESVVGASHTKTSELELFNRDWTNQFKGNAPSVLLPGSTEEVSALLAHCAKRRIAVVPQAGNTGMVGGSIPVHDEVIISIKRINQHFDFNPTTGILECDAGIILEELDNKLAKEGFMMPLDLGAKGSCMIGGNIATSAGGVRLVRYGSLHSHLLGLTAVLPDESGSILRVGSSLRKDNTSLHVAHLFLGSEGQLGILTRATLGVVARPASVQSAMLGVSTFDSCRAVLRLARSRLSEILSSFELMDEQTMTCLKENLNLNNVLGSRSPFNLLVETSGSNATHDIEKMDAFLEECVATGLADDGVQAQSTEEAAHMWKLRESATLALVKDGYVYKNDVSLPLEHFYQLTEEVRKRSGHLATRVITYGHLGDGNSHLNVTSNKFNQELYDSLYPFIYKWVSDHGGSISAEHGIGQLKRDYCNYGKSKEERQLVRKLKDVFDPHGIMNPYKTF